MICTLLLVLNFLETAISHQIWHSHDNRLNDIEHPHHSYYKSHKYDHHGRRNEGSCGRNHGPHSHELRNGIENFDDSPLLMMAPSPEVPAPPSTPQPIIQQGSQDVIVFTYPVPAMPPMPGMFGMPELGMPWFPGMPGMPWMQGMPWMPGFNGMPRIPILPGIPGLPWFPGMPGFPGAPTASSAATTQKHPVTAETTSRTNRYPSESFMPESSTMEPALIDLITISTMAPHLRRRNILQQPLPKRLSIMPKSNSILSLPSKTFPRYGIIKLPDDVGKLFMGKLKKDKAGGKERSLNYLF